MTDYKLTINLPQTDFPMKADLPKREPQMLADWERSGIYAKSLAVARGRPRFVLHDGPPYANGTIHMGHALNKVLKDIIVKSRVLEGFEAPYIPGWDCHGLPIEHAVEKKHGRPGTKLDANQFRAACRAFAAEQVALQRADFQRLGVFGDWDHPYLTMDPRYEAMQIRALGKVIANGHLYKGAKPVHWCLDCRSALAEAEVEYEDKTSSAIDVEFRVVDHGELAARTGIARVADAIPTSIVIWTTTAWTLPANEAVALRGEFDYALIEFDRVGEWERIIVATELAPACLLRYGIDPAATRRLGSFAGRVLEGLKLEHPFLPREVPVILGDHVTLEAGTGAVHTAPAHGQEDFVVGQRYGLPVRNPVGGDGRFLLCTPFVEDLRVDKAEEVIATLLSERGRLLNLEKYRHSYPHCWRHHTPLIFRATPQWFIGMESNGLRAGALRDIAQVAWTPAWGEARIAGMIANRPDWCISRQRVWGVPIALFVHRQSGELHPRTQALLEDVAQRVEVGGIEAWFALAPEEILGAEAADYEKVTDVMDVWADSGLSFECVGRLRPEVQAPVDLYLEGSDQHRGWFHSSLLMSEALHARAPYRAVLTHGFTVDEKGRKMSKSLGNTILPQKVISNLGADVLRLWVASTDYSNEIAVSDEILKRMADSYRRMRNTVRFLLGNLHGFDPATDQLPPAGLVALDAWALARSAALQEELRTAYRTFDFHLIYQKLHNFCVLDLGGFYLDVLKDRLYTTPARSLARRSAQTAMFHIAESMVRWLAPILSFTSEEIWRHLPGSRSESVFLETWHRIPGVPAPALDWKALIALRTDVLRELEQLREAGTIGAPLEAEVDVYATAEFAARFAALGEELRFLFIVSQARVHTVTVAPTGAVPATAVAADGVWLSVARTAASKCVRCWHHRPEVGTIAGHPELCGRCVVNLGAGETRRFA